MMLLKCCSQYVSKFAKLSSGWNSLVAPLRATCKKASACNVGDLGSIPGSGRFPWRRKWQPTPVFLPGESHGWRSLVGYSPRGRKESDRTDRLHFHFKQWPQEWKSSVFIPIPKNAQTTAQLHSSHTLEK